MEFIKKHSYLLRSLLVFLGFVFLLFPMGNYSAFDEVIYEFNGIELIFGFQTEKYKILGFNCFGFILFILLICGIIVPMLYNKIKIIGTISETIGMIIAIVLYVLLPITIVHKSSEVPNIFNIYPTIYIASSLLILALFLCVYELLVQFKGERK